MIIVKRQTNPTDMDDVDLDYREECIGTNDILPMDHEFICMWRLKRESDMAPLGPLDPPKQADLKSSPSSRGPSLNVVGERPPSNQRYGLSLENHSK
jgi:hypothetical protein